MNTGRTRFKKGHIPWIKGKKMSREFGEKIAKRNSSKLREESYGWKGDRINYGAKHYRVYAEKGKPNKCVSKECIYPRKGFDGKQIQKPGRYEWATIHGRGGLDINDYIELCASCHRKYDLDNSVIQI